MPPTEQILDGREAAVSAARDAALDGLLTIEKGVAPAKPPASTPSRYARRALFVDASVLAFVALLVTIASPTDSPTGGVPQTPPGWLLVMSAAVVLCFYVRGMYVPPLRLELTEALRMVVAGTALAVTVVMTARVLTANDPYVAAETVRYWLVAIVTLTAGRGVVLLLEARARRAGEAVRRTLIVGSGKVGMLAAKRLLKEPELGLRPVGFFDNDPLEPGTAPEGLPVLHGRTLDSAVRELGVNHVIIAFSRASHEELLALARDCWRLGVTVSVVPRLFEIEGERVVTEHLGGLPLVEMRPTDPRGWQFRVKYAFDRLVAGIALALLFPVLALVAAAVRVTMGNPIFYRQLRVGRDGHTFEMIKFRTMRASTGESDADWAEQQLGADVGAEHDPEGHRVSRLGSFLRRTSVDELPQLWNVLRGDMSLVGPRPERASYVERFEQGLYRYGERHRVKSGLTGWAQVHGLRGKTSLLDRTEWDNHYIENWSLWLDLKIMLMTARAVVRGQGQARELSLDGETLR
jgi:exopolysaccharide biosynthesis polyprenyl glycosylphosphotransferase